METLKQFNHKLETDCINASLEYYEVITGFNNFENNSDLFAVCDYVSSLGYDMSVLFDMIEQAEKKDLEFKLNSINKELFVLKTLRKKMEKIKNEEHEQNLNLW